MDINYQHFCAQPYTGISLSNILGEEAKGIGDPQFMFLGHPRPFHNHMLDEGFLRGPKMLLFNYVMEYNFE